MTLERDEIEKLKSSLDLVGYAEHLGIELNQVGHRYRGCCPFHEDRTPSFYVNPNEGFYYCFGCGMHGDAISLAREIGKLSFAEAIDDLRSYLGNTGLRKFSEKVKKPQQELSGESNKLLDSIVRQYHENLNDIPEASDYLASRKVSKKAIKDFEIGYCGRQSIRYPSSHRESLQEIGFLNHKGNETYYRRVTVPIRNRNGEFSQLYGRRIDGSNRFRHRYLALKHSTPFNPKALESSEIFLTESVIDALTLYSYGIENVVGTYGTNSFKEDYLRLMTESNTRKVVISYDNDMAGNSAATYLTGILNENGIEAFRLGLPSGLDVNGYFCQTDYPRVKIDKL